MNTIPTASSEDHLYLALASQWQTWLCAASLLMACTGCWDEIPYEPTQASATPAKTKLPQQPDPPEPHSSTQPDEPEVTTDSTEIKPEEESTAPPAEDFFADDDSPTEDTTPPGPEQPVAEDALADLEEPSANEAPTETTPESTNSTSPRTTIAIWQMGSKWSLAAAYYAKGIGIDRYGNLLDEANYAAQLISLELPGFSDLGDDPKRQAQIATFLINNAGPKLVEAVADKYSKPDAALADLAIKTHALLLVYTPLNEELETIVTAVRSSAEKSTLPTEIWSPLVELIEQRATFDEVKKSVFQLHKQVSAHLSD